jgi:hypothetical protein
MAVINFTPGKKSRYLYGLQSGSGQIGEGEKFLNLPGIELSVITLTSDQQ